MDKILAAQRIRTILERRIAAALGCKPVELPPMRLGTLAHMMFLLFGDGETMGGFNTTLTGLLRLVGHELLWADAETKEETEETKPVAETIN